MRSVMCFCRDPRSGYVLLLVKVKPDVWNGLADAVAGTLRDGEDPAAGMARKMEEEVGLIVDPFELQLRAALQTPNGVVHVFRWEGNIFAAQKREDERPQHFPGDSNWAREPVVPNLRWLIPLVFSGDVTGVVEVPHK